MINILNVLYAYMKNLNRNLNNSGIGHSPLSENAPHRKKPNCAFYINERSCLHGICQIHNIAKIRIDLEYM